MPIIMQPVAGDSSVFLDISAALENRLELMPLLPPVAWENRKYTPIKDVLYLRPTNIPGDTLAITDSQDETIGIYQIDIFAPMGDGKNEVVTMADKVADHFKQDTIMSYLSQSVRVKSVSRSAIRTDDNGWLHINVDVTYYAFSDRR